jgi:hypothetical protein
MIKSATKVCHLCPVKVRNSAQKKSRGHCGTFDMTNSNNKKQEMKPMKRTNKQEIPCFTEARSTFFGSRGSNSRFLVFFIISMKFPIDRVPSCLIFGIWDFGRIRECTVDHGNVLLNFPRAKTFRTSPHMFNLRQRNPSYT